MGQWAEKFGSVLARVGLGLVALGTTALSLHPATAATIDPEKAFAVAVAVIAWLFSEVMSAKNPPPLSGSELSPHDTDLATRLRSIATDDFIRFLDEHDFGGSFRDNEAIRIHDLADFTRYASSEFDDPDIQTCWRTAASEAIQFSRLIAYGSAPKNWRAVFYTLIPEDEPDGMWSDETVAKVAEANGKADDLSNSLKALLRTLRQRGFVTGGREVADNQLQVAATQ